MIFLNHSLRDRFNIELGGEGVRNFQIRVCTGGFDLACSLQDFVQRVHRHVTCRSCLCFRNFTFRQFVFTSCMAPPACVCGADLSCLESGPPTFEFLANHGRITRLSVNLVQTVQTGVQTVEFRGVFVQTVQTIEKVFLFKKRKFRFHGLYGLYESPTVSNGLYNGLYTVCTFPVGKGNHRNNPCAFS